jgi:molecular chaperone DnaJ
MQRTWSDHPAACKECKGHRRERKLKVNIPAGVDNGTQMRLAQEGHPGANGGPPGDLFVVLKVAEHPIFERHEYDLHCTVPVNIAQAALGCSVDVLTFDGLQHVKVPEGSQAGARLRLKGLGVPHLNSSSRGDLFARFRQGSAERERPAVCSKNWRRAPYRE